MSSYQSPRNSVISSRSSNYSWIGSEAKDDMIRPCPPEDARSMECHAATSPAIPHTELGVPSRMAAADRGGSSRAKVDDVRGLWECMLELQQRYGCYKSARMQAAVSVHEDGLDLMRE
jgi:hypothetical protein